MARRFKRVDYEQSRQQVVTLGECLPSDHLVYFVVKTIAGRVPGHCGQIKQGAKGPQPAFFGPKPAVWNGFYTRQPT